MFVAGLGITVTAWAAPLDGGDGAGFDEDEPVTPASVMKVQIGLAAERAIAAGTLDGGRQSVLLPERRTPGPTGISLLRDEVRMTVRDLVTQMLTVSDNVATDELLALLGVDQVNGLTAELGLTRTRIVGDLRTMLDDMAAEAGFPDYATLAGTEPPPPGLLGRLAGTAALDPARGSHTTAADTVRLLRAVWRDPAGGRVRQAMADQLTRHRVASGFGPEFGVAAKSGGLMGIVRNEAGVVTRPGGDRYAVAVFTRRPPGSRTDPSLIDAAIGRTARTLVDRLSHA